MTRSSKRSFIFFLRAKAEHAELDKKFQTYLMEHQSIQLTMAKISEHVITLVGVDEDGDNWFNFLSDLDHRVSHPPEPAPVASMPPAINALTDGVPGSIRKSRRDSNVSNLTDMSIGQPSAGYFDPTSPASRTSSTNATAGAPSLASSNERDNESQVVHSGVSVGEDGSAAMNDSTAGTEQK